MNRRDFIGGCAAGAVAVGLPAKPSMYPVTPLASEQPDAKA